MAQPLYEARGIVRRYGHVPALRGAISRCTRA